MGRRWTGPLIAALFLPAGLVLGLAARSLPGQTWAGLVLHEDEVVTVVPGGPADRAGIFAGDRLRLPGTRSRLAPSPLSFARPGSPLVLERERAGAREPVWLVPDSLPAAEWRMGAALLTVAAGFVLLASLVWSERRDRLTRSFVLLCLGFAVLLAPLPRWPTPAAAIGYELVYGVVTLLLPALVLHFFALFPEPPGGASRTAKLPRAGYALAFLLILATTAAQALPPLAPLAPLLETAAAVWFAGGLLAALVLFVRSYARAGDSDAQRRLRVAVGGVVLGAAPLAVASLLRNLAPGARIPLDLDRLAVLGTLLVPASFAWAIAVHRLFDFGVAVRIGAAAAVVAAGAGVATFGPEWVAARTSAATGGQVAQVMLGLLVAGAVVAGPVSQRIRGLRTLLPAPASDAALASWAARVAPETGGATAPMLDDACRTLRESLRLDRCVALEIDGRRARIAAIAGAPLALGELSPALLATLRDGPGLLAVEELAGTSPDRARLERAGVRWMLPIGEAPRRVALLLGRRIAGTWLGQLETRDLGRFAEHLAIALENATLRRAARARGAIDRQLAIAGELQAHRLPRRTPAYPTLDCAAAALAGAPVGGDYYDFVELSPREFVLAVGDAAGTGVPAAIVMAGVQTRFRTEAARGATPGEVLATLNRELVAFDQPDRFMALLCARVDVRAARVWIANAGLPPPLVRRRDGRLETLEASGVLLGVSRDAVYPDTRVELDAGDTLVLHTDGLTEARRGDELWGPARLAGTLDGCGSRRAADTLEALLEAVRRFADRPLDDLTLVVLRQLAPPARDHGVRNALKSPEVAAEPIG